MADKQTAADVLGYVATEDVKFIRLAFLSPSGKQKNISIMPGELRRAFSSGIAIDPQAAGFDVPGGLLLRPDPATLSVLPWRPEHGRVVRMFCGLYLTDGSPCSLDTRGQLVNKLEMYKNLDISSSQRIEFYLIKPGSGEPLDMAAAMDMAPDDRGENTRREVCLHLEEMGIPVLRSYHLTGPGQNTVELGPADLLTAADNFLAAATAIRAAAERNGLRADLTETPLKGEPKNGMALGLTWRDYDPRTANKAARSVENTLPGCQALVTNERLTVRLDRPASDPYKTFTLLAKCIGEVTE